MTARRISDLVKTMTGKFDKSTKSAAAKELNGWINSAAIKLTTPWEPSIIPIPEPFDGFTLDAWQAVCRNHGGLLK